MTLLFPFIITMVIFSLNIPNALAKDLLVVRVDANYPPYEMVVNGELKGLHIDLVKAVAKRLDLNIQIKTLPWKRALDMVKVGDADAITYIGKTAERQVHFIYDAGNVLSSSVYGFVILPERAQQIKFNGELKSMTDYKIGVQNGYSYGDKVDNASYLKKQSVKSLEQLVQLLLVRRIDLAIIDEQEYFQKNKDGTLIMLMPRIVKRDYYVAFSVRNNLEKQSQEFSNEMLSFKKSQKYKDMLSKYELIK